MTLAADSSQSGALGRHIDVGRLHAHDHTFPITHAAFPTVLRPTGDARFETLRDALAERRADVRAELQRAGAILLRGFEIADVEQFEALFAALEIPLSPNYPLGVAARERVGAFAWTTTQLLDVLPLTPHSEMAYRRLRPRVLGLFCQVAPPRHGETPIFDARAALADLAPATRAALAAGDISWLNLYHRRRGWFATSYEKSWPEVFATEDRVEVERACAALGARCEWGRRGQLWVVSDTPSILRHPDSGAETLAFQTIHLETFLANLELLRARHGALKTAVIRLLIRGKAALGTYPFAARWATGGPVPAWVFRGVYEALWRHATVFRWQPGDVLLLDNLLVHHGRLNVVRPRSIYVGLGDMRPV